MAPIVRQEHRNNLDAAVALISVAHQAALASNAYVCRAPCLAHGTASVTTPCSAHTTLATRYST